MLRSDELKEIYKRCLKDRCPQIAASLAYVSLLALIPLTALIYKIYTVTFVDPELQIKTQTFILDSLSPAVANDVQQYLLSGASQVSSINIFGLIMLLLSVIVTMHTIDSALNRIWNVTVTRNLIRRIFVYFSLLIFGPLAISFSLFISAYVASLPLLTNLVGESIFSRLYHWLPFLVLWAAFTMLYKWIPACKVRWKEAFIGATFAVIIFEIAKLGFTLYVSYFPSYEILYGALAAIPLLLIWIYLTWLIVLVGAEIAYFVSDFS